MGNRHLKIIFLVLGIFLFFKPGESQFAQTPLKSPAQPYIEAGDRLYEQGKLKEALSAYEQALAIEPKNQYVSFQIIRINVKLASGENPITEAIPSRDYTKISRELGPYYKDSVNKFAIKYPVGWLVDNSDPYFNLKLIDPYYEAFIFIKSVPTPQPLQISYEFQSQVESLVKNIVAQVPGARLGYCNFEKLLDQTVLRVEVIYQAGQNIIVINSRVLIELDRAVIVTWVTQEKLLPYFRVLLESSVATITLNPQ